ncbi:MAG: hypothetical protein CFE44_06415 [Burkholderiales bacterium PBB4]|nr:MAG: hypothetical protein CFE44_06415 [Burkholderiales bacterium PBB4]
MGTCCDHEFICKGGKDAVEKARKAIERFKAKHAEYSGNGDCCFDHVPEISAAGSKLRWACYSVGLVDKVRTSLVRLTKASDLEFHDYIGCTDGTNEGWLTVYEDGQIRERHEFGADIGMRAASSVAALIRGLNDAAFADLIASYRDATEGNILVETHQELMLEDEKYERCVYGVEYERDGVIAGYIGESLSAYPQFLANNIHQKKLLRLLRAFITTRAWVDKFRLCEPETREHLAGLVARLESLEIAGVAKAPSRKRAGHVQGREANRI